MRPSFSIRIIRYMKVDFLELVRRAETLRIKNIPHTNTQKALGSAQKSKLE